MIGYYVFRKCWTNMEIWWIETANNSMLYCTFSFSLVCCSTEKKETGLPKIKSNKAKWKWGKKTQSSAFEETHALMMYAMDDWSGIYYLKLVKIDEFVYLEDFKTDDTAARCLSDNFLLLRMSINSNNRRKQNHSYTWALFEYSII